MWHAKRKIELIERADADDGGQTPENSGWTAINGTAHVRVSLYFSNVTKALSLVQPLHEIVCSTHTIARVA